MLAYHRPRGGAIALTVLFAAGTFYTLFEDVLRHGAPLTVSHVQTFLALIGTIAAGHKTLPELSNRRWLSAIGCALLFTSGTAYIVTASGARNADVSQAKAAEADKLADARQAASSKLADAERDVAEYRDLARAAAAAAKKECGSGKGTRCDGANSSRVYADRDLEKAESHAALMRARLEAMPPAKDGSGGYAHAAAVFAALPGVTASAADIETRLVLLMPFLLVAITELGTLVFAAQALRAPPATHTAGETAQTSFAVANDDLPTVQAFLASRQGDSDPQPPKPGARARTLEREAKVASFVSGYRARHGREPEPREVRQATGLPRATAHRYQRRVG